MNGEPESGLEEVEGASLYYEAAGFGEPLVLVHAGITHRRMWDTGNSGRSPNATR